MALVLSPRLCVTSIDAQPFVKSVCEGFPLATEVCAQEGISVWGFLWLAVQEV